MNHGEKVLTAACGLPAAGRADTGLSDMDAIPHLRDPFVAEPVDACRLRACGTLKVRSNESGLSRKLRSSAAASARS